MAGFFPHTGILNSGYTALAPSSYANILSDIVTDIGAGVNGWTVFDDQRAPGGGATSIYVAHQRGFASGGYTSATFTFTNASATVVGYMMPTFREVIVGTTQISLDQTNWYTISALVAPSSNNYNLTLSAPWGQATVTNNSDTARAYLKVPTSYIVLKCTTQNSMKNFFVKLDRVGYGDVLRVQVFEDWNATTHVGTNGGPQEIMRAWDHSNAFTLGYRIQYILWLLPDTFGLWTSGFPGDQANGTWPAYPLLMADFFYAGSLIPRRSGDTGCIMQASTNQELSGVGPYYNDVTFSTASLTFSGGAPVMYGIRGESWVNPTRKDQLSGYNVYMIYPRGSAYMFGLDRTKMDEAGRTQYCVLDAYEVGPGNVAAGSTQNVCGKRGELRYLKMSIHNPSGSHLLSIAGDDGNTYISVRASYPMCYANSGTPNAAGLTAYDISNWSPNTPTQNGFTFGARQATVAEVKNPNIYGLYGVPRFFLMPTTV